MKCYLGKLLSVCHKLPHVFCNVQWPSRKQYQWKRARPALKFRYITNWKDTDWTDWSCFILCIFKFLTQHMPILFATYCQKKFDPWLLQHPRPVQQTMILRWRLTLWTFNKRRPHFVISSLVSTTRPVSFGPTLLASMRRTTVFRWASLLWLQTAGGHSISSATLSRA